MYPKNKWKEVTDEGSIYSRVSRIRLVDEDALSIEEAGFMEGYEEGLQDVVDDWVEMEEDLIV
jgi:hypothetical protein